MTPQPTTTVLSHREIMRIFAGIMIAMFLGALDQTIVATAGPTIVGELGSLESLPWIFSIYMLTSTAVVPLFGKLSDLYGRRALLQIAVVIFIVGSIAVGAAQSMPQMIAARGVQGLGAGGLVPLSLAVVGDILPSRERGRYMGYITSVFALASIAGPLVGGFFVDHLSWRWGFYINVPLSLVALAVIRRNLPAAAPREHVDIDYAGAALVTASLSSLLLVTVFIDTFGVASPWTLAMAVVSIVTMIGLVVVERSASEPIVPPVLFRDPVFNVSNVLGVLLGLAMFGALVFLPLFLQVAQGRTATASGLLLVPQMLGLTVSSIVTGRLVTRFGRYRIFAIVGAAILAASMAGLMTIERSTSAVVICVLVFGLGAAIGMSMPTLTTAIQNSVPSTHLGAATSLSQFFRSIGGIVGVSAFGAILAAQVSSKVSASLLGGEDVGDLIADPEKVSALAEPTRSIVRDALTEGIVVIIAIGTIAALLGFVASFFLREKELSGDMKHDAEVV